MGAYGGPVAGWYPDPAGSGSLRWWDGLSWSSRLAAPTPPAPNLDLEGEEAAARWARAALLVAIPSQIAGWALMRVWMADFRDQIESGGSIEEARQFGGTGLAVLDQLPNAVAGVTAVLFLIWFFRSASNAHKLGLPATRSPAAGVAGFLVPVINLWWPYQSTRDLLPAGHPDRPLVLRWFLLWVVGGAVSFIMVVASMFLDSGAGWALVAVPAALTTLAGLAARQVVANALAAHQVLASRRY